MHELCISDLQIIFKMSDVMSDIDYGWLADLITTLRPVVIADSDYGCCDTGIYLLFGVIAVVAVGCFFIRLVFSIIFIFPSNQNLLCLFFRVC